MLSAGAYSVPDILFGLFITSIRKSYTRAVSDTRCLYQTNREEGVMNTNLKIALAVVVGAAFGAAAMQGLNAQAKPKAYSVSELETIDAAAQAAYTALIQAAQKSAGAVVNFNTAGGRVVGTEGPAAPKRVAITEWASLEQAQSFYNSAAYKNLAPQRDKAVKTIRRYVVEAVN
jgi:uncharacterized protein (DUF1330 family)